MLLALDVGNTNIVVGVFNEVTLTTRFRIGTNPHVTGDELGFLIEGLLQQRGVKVSDIDGVVIGNVVPALTRSLHSFTRDRLGLEPILVEQGINLGLRILCDQPRQVGADLLANAVAVKRRYGGPAIVVDFGTATTVDALSADGDFLGTAIAPGLLISRMALAQHAAQLDRVELVVPPSVIGRDTTTAVQAGLVTGHIAMVEGLVARMKVELGGSAKVVATGGLASLVAEHTLCIDVVDDHLTLDGLRLIYELNVENGGVA